MFRLVQRSGSSSATLVRSRAMFSTGLTPLNVALAEGLLSGNRSCLAKSITLIESSRSDHQEQADLLLGYLATADKQKESKKPRFQHNKTLRLGFAGPPGGNITDDPLDLAGVPVYQRGKSSLIEKIGMQYINQGLRVAVIPVDPSSHRSGGSILGDKTRMDELSKSTSAYVRASPTKCFLGGIAQHTVDVVSLCEYANFDVVIVETVGLGQSEVELEQAVDLFCLLVSPGGGDDLQASKKGVMEAVDLLLVSKADGDLLRTAKHTKADYGGSLSLIRKKNAFWSPRAQLISSRSGLGVDTFLDTVAEFHTIMTESGQLEKKRTSQAKHWMWAQFQSMVVEKVRQSSEASRLADDLERQLACGGMSSRHAAGLLLKKTFGLS